MTSLTEARNRGGKAPAAPLRYAPARVSLEHRPDGSLVLTSPVPLAPYAPTLAPWLDRWAAEVPDRLFLAERPAPGAEWRRLTYGEAAARAAALAEALLERGLGPERPLMILSGNSIDHALLTLAGLQAGVPVVPISPAYSLMSRDFAKLRHIAGLIRPGLVYVSALEPFAAALAALETAEGGIAANRVLTSQELPAGSGAISFADLVRTLPSARLEAARAEIGADTVAKILFTSGSTGLPKGVINTHGMLSANQQMIAQTWPFLDEAPPVLLDWLPWNHTFGGNHNFNLVLAQGGTLYIDGGKPAPGLVEQTIANLGEVSPTIYFNVPAGFSMLAPRLEADPELARRFFARLRLIFYAGAALPQDLWERFEALSARTLGRRVTLTSSWGSTETAPLATSAHFPLERAGVIGIPAPGVAIKLVPSGGKQEMRVKGPNVMPGYWRQPDLTAAAFDEEGYYKIGDAGRLADPDHPEAGILFDGRITEDFKLSTGTWVHVGGLRVALLSAAAALLQDAVISGQDRDEIGVLAWLNPAVARETCPHPEHRERIEGQGAAALIACPDVRARLARSLAAYNAAQAGSSTRVARLLLMEEPPSIDANEITDKGYVNQRAVLERRQALVEKLYAEPASPDVIRLA